MKTGFFNCFIHSSTRLCKAKNAAFEQCAKANAEFGPVEVKIDKRSPLEQQKAAIDSYRRVYIPTYHGPLCFPTKTKEKDKMMGHYLIPFEEEMRVERRLFREGAFAKLLIRVERGVWEKMYGGNDFFFSKTKKKKKYLLLGIMSLFLYTDCSISIIVILEIIFQLKSIPFFIHSFIHLRWPPSSRKWEEKNAREERKEKKVAVSLEGDLVHSVEK